MRFFKSLTLALVLLCGLALTTQAASIDPFPIEKWVTDGTEAIFEPLDITKAGTYKATIVDFGVTDFFDTLIFAVLNETGAEDWVDAAGGMGMFTFDADPNVDYFAAILAITKSDKTGLFRADIAHVPIPPSLLLLGSGLVSLVVLRRRRS